MKKGNNKKSNKGMVKIRPVLLSVAGMALTFIIGLSINDYQYRNIPRETIVTQRSTTEIDTENKLIQAKGIANTIVARDAEIIGDVNDYAKSYDDRFNGGRSINPDGLKDIMNLEDKRQPLLDELNAL